MTVGGLGVCASVAAGACSTRGVSLVVSRRGAQRAWSSASGSRCLGCCDGPTCNRVAEQRPAGSEERNAGGGRGGGADTDGLVLKVVVVVSRSRVGQGSRVSRTLLFAVLLNLAQQTQRQLISASWRLMHSPTPHWNPLDAGEQSRRAESGAEVNPPAVRGVRGGEKEPGAEPPTQPLVYRFDFTADL